MKITKSFLLCVPLLTVILAARAAVSAPPIPNPMIYFMGSVSVQEGKKTFIRYRYDVFNKDAYPAQMFAPAPDLPPCGKNTKSSRTWVDLFDQSGKRLYGFCALAKPADLNQLYFALEDNVIPPSWIYSE